MYSEPPPSIHSLDRQITRLRAAFDEEFDRVMHNAGSPQRLAQLEIELRAIILRKRQLGYATGHGWTTRRPQ